MIIFFKKIVSIITFFIFNGKLRRRIRNYLYNKIDYYFVFHRYSLKLSYLKKKKKINVLFLVVFDSVFPAKPLFEKLLKEDLFSPKLLVIPDCSRGQDNMFYQLKKSYDYFFSLYGSDCVICSFDYVKGVFIDYVNECDLACFANPYDSMTKKKYSIEYYSSKGVLPIYISYGTMPDYYARDNIINLKSINLCWKVFVDTKDNLEDFISYTDLKGKNTILSGYCKMDSLNNIEKIKLSRKKIIIAPHHTVNSPSFHLSNFLEYSDFFLELPERYPQIDFVFRPHPLLFVTLLNEELWGEKKVEAYIREMSSFPNVEYQNGGDYFYSFVNSSAIIHDCSSFIMEYLYTDHPACYMLRSEKEIDELFAPIGKACLKHYYKALNKESIINFIENVVLLDHDPMKDERIMFSRRNLMLNYPNVAEFIVRTLKKEINS